MLSSGDINKDHLKIKLKRGGFFLFLLPAVLPFAGFVLANSFGYANLFAWLTVFVMYGCLPILDVIVGKDPHNIKDTEVKELGADNYYRYLLWLCVPVAIISLTGGLYLFQFWSELSFIGQLGLVISFGMIGASIMINAGHELVHKSTRLEQNFGGILLSLVSYPSFKIEHVRGHHVHVATPADQSTSQYGQSLYNFLVKAISRNFRTAWKLEATLLQKRGKKVLSWDNELIRWYALVLAIIVVVGIIFGPSGVAFFMLQSIVAIALLETINYVEHYGLRRKMLANGRYERTTHEHSWNSNYLLTNLMLFQLQRHSDHHANPTRPYQVLRHFDDSPQLPAGYSAMILLALFPPLWKKIMNPRVDRYYRKASEVMSRAA